MPRSQQRKPRFETLAEAFPRVAEEWDRKLNGNLSPKDVARFSNKKAHWKCKSGHRWIARIANRTKRGSGCPTCAGNFRAEAARKSRLAKTGSLKTQFPEIAAEWDSKRNDRSPREISAGSKYLAHWKCRQCGRLWVATVNNRTKKTRATGCPACGETQRRASLQSRILRQSGSLEKKIPELAAQWHPTRNSNLTAADVTAGSNVKVWWLCERKHAWRTTPKSRASGSGCPECSNAKTSRLEIYILCELRSIYRDVRWREKIAGKECDIYIPRIRLGIEIDGGYWHADSLDGDRSKSRAIKREGVTLVRVRDDRLPPITGHVVKFANSENQSVTTLRLIEYLTGLYTSRGLFKYFREGRRRSRKAYQAIVRSLPSPPPGESFLDYHPTRASEWDYEFNAPLRPEMFWSAASKKAGFKCKLCEHKYVRTIGRHARSLGCPRCMVEGRTDSMRRTKLARQGSFAKHCPHLVRYWDKARNKLRPKDVGRGSKYQALWNCPKCGRKWKQSVAVFARSQGCSNCFNGRRGRNNPNSKLDERKVRSIRRRVERGELHTSIAKDYGVSITLIGLVARGKIWVWVD